MMQAARLENSSSSTGSRGIAATGDLVVFMNERDRDAIEIARGVAKRAPLRLILVDATTRADARSVELLSTIVCDTLSPVMEIRLDVAGRGPLEVTSLIRHALLREVPTSVWWASPLPVDARLAEAAKLAQVLIIDSADRADGFSALEAVTATIRDFPRPSVTDLVWLRLEPWRVAVSRLFDAPDAMADLHRLTTVELHGAIPECRYMAGWLASRLGWRFASHAHAIDRTGRTIAIGTRPVGTRRMHGITLLVDDGAYSLTLTPSGAGLERRIDKGGQSTSAVVPFTVPDTVTLIEQSIVKPATPETFEATLRTGVNHDA